MAGLIAMTCYIIITIIIRRRTATSCVILSDTILMAFIILLHRHIVLLNTLLRQITRHCTILLFCPTFGNHPPFTSAVVVDVSDSLHLPITVPNTQTITH